MAATDASALTKMTVRMVTQHRDPADASALHGAGPNTTRQLTRLCVLNLSTGEAVADAAEEAQARHVGRQGKRLRYCMPPVHHVDSVELLTVLSALLLSYTVLLKRLQDHLGLAEEDSTTTNQEATTSPGPTPSAIEIPKTAPPETNSDEAGTVSTNLSAVPIAPVNLHAENEEASATSASAFTAKRSESLDDVMEAGSEESLDASVELQSAATEEEEVALPEAPDSSEAATVTTLRIDNFRRPFTLNAVKEHGEFVENGFWMDAIKTHCYVSYASNEVASKTRESLQGKVWPPGTGIALSVDFSQQSAMDVNDNGGDAPHKESLKRKATDSEPEAAPSGASSQRRGQGAPVSIDALFLKTETKPVLYYLPLTDEQVKQRKERQRNQASGAQATVEERAIRNDNGARGTPPSKRGKRGRRSKKARDGYRQVQRYDSRF